MPLGSRAGDVLARGLLACTRSLWAIEKVMTGFVEEAAPGLLDLSGRRAFTNRVWERSGVCAPDDPLFAWEETWFRADLPPAPARILIGAAGRGREARWLARQGYEVTAFEPVADFLEDLRGVGVRRAEAISYEDLSARRDEGIWRAAPYDAFVLGWGSFSCIDDRAERAAILKAGAQLAPRGPILLSYLRFPVASGRSRQLGRSLARGLGLSNPGFVQNGDRLYAHLGFIHPLDDAELEQLVRATARRLKAPPARDFEYPHATLLPA